MKANRSSWWLAIWAVVTSCWMMAAISAGAQSFSYPDFTSTNGLVIIDAAGLAGSSLRLTPAAQNQAGTVWYGNKQFCAAGFSTSFHFQITDTGSVGGYPAGADGISFSVQNVSTSVDSYEYGPALNSLGVSFNTFWNPGLEVSDNFVGICTNTHWIMQRDLNPTPIRLKDGNVHLAEIVCDGATLSVTIDGLPVITNFPVPLANGLDAGGNGWVGLGARCGISYENHDILDWNFAPLTAAAPLILTQPVSQTVFSGGNAGFSVLASSSQALSYQWYFNGTNIAGATNSALSLPSVQPTHAGAYFVEVSNSVGSVTSSNAQLTVLIPAASGCFTYADFGITNGLAIIGNAEQVGTNLQLTPSATSQAGAAWYSGKQSCVGGFTSTFQFQISNLGAQPGLTPGADGISFSIQNSGLNVEPSEYSAPTNGVGVSFNTFWNPGLEVSGNFVGICTNGANWVLQQDLTGTGINLKDGNIHTALVQYDGAALSVTMDNQAIISAYPISISNAVDNTGSAWVGFGARTGGSWEQHDILNWSFCGLTNTSINHPPVANSQSVSVQENSSVSITLTATDADGDALTFSAGAPAHGVLSGTAPNLIYTPAVGYVGGDQFSFTANDGKASSAKALVTIQVTPVYQPPVARITVSPLANVPGVPGLTVISANDSNATVLFDGGLSSDISNTPLTSVWSEGGTEFSTNSSCTDLLSVGSHAIMLVVSDGIGAGTNSVVLQVLAATTVNCVSYPDFSSTNGLAIIGNAAQVGTNLQLTPPAALQQGAAWYSNKLSCTGGFTSTFQFQISNLGAQPGLTPGADGISFSIQNSGLNVEPVEYSSPTNGVGVSFNTFWNPGLEVSGNFVGICTNGGNWVLQHDLTGTGINLKDGNVHTAVVQYNGAALSVTVDNRAIIIGYPISISSAVDNTGSAWVGFGARTGGSWEQHDILNWSFCNQTNLPMGLIPTANIQLSPVASNLSVAVPLIISPNNSNALVVLDGSGSSDAHNDPLQYSWSSGGPALATTPVYSNIFGIGFRSITLAVSNGTNTSSTNVSFNVLTPSRAVFIISSQLETPPVPGAPPLFANTQPALSALSLANSFFLLSDMADGASELADFQNSLQSQITASNAAFAAVLIGEAQDIIDAVSASLPAANAASPTKASISQVVVPTVKQAMHARFIGVPGKPCNIEASSDMRNWQVIGSAIADQNGVIDFIDAYAANFPVRYYRLAAP